MKSSAGIFRARRLLAGLTIAAITLVIASSAFCQEKQDTIAPGTVITIHNWRKYRNFFSAGLQTFWEGKGFWKMPSDVRIKVAAPQTFKLPQPVIDADEKYGGRAKLLRLPDGRWKFEGYVAGFPFPNPSGPNKALEIAADVTYRAQPYLFAGSEYSGAPVAFYAKDRFGDLESESADYVYRQLAYNWEPNVPQTNPDAGGEWYSEWLMIEKPEQSRYTADLTILWQNNLKPESNYVFLPSLRRSMQLASSARCSPLLGSDMTHDDQRIGWNGGVGIFNASFIRAQKLLTLARMSAAAGRFPEEYDGMLGWPKPSLGAWELRKVWVIDLRRIPSMASGYCYGKRIMYVDRQYYLPLAEDLYDSTDKLWKVEALATRPAPFDTYGKQLTAGGATEIFWDVQNDHATYITTLSPDGKTVTIDSAVAKRYRDIARYSMPGGLMQIMR